MAGECLPDIQDDDNCVRLSMILKHFNAPINEEQCWALAYQTIKHLHSFLLDKVCVVGDHSQHHSSPPPQSFLTAKNTHTKTSINSSASRHNNNNINNNNINNNNINHTTTTNNNNNNSIKCDSLPVLYILNGPHDLYVHRDGYVHEKTFTKTDCQRRLSTSLNKVVASIGATLFVALDYGFGSQEERSLDPSLEQLIDLLTSSESSFCGGGGGGGGGDEAVDDDNGEVEEDKDEIDDKEFNDEGIERDSPEYEGNPLHEDPLSLVKQVLTLCTQRIGPQAEAHYKAVCRALVAEAIELSSFLLKITSVTAELSNHSINSEPRAAHSLPFDLSGSSNSSSATSSLAIDALKLQDWARLWMQVIHELRNGVKLRKVDLSEKPSIEFEMTPYEMLLDDIRSRRYKLNKVLLNGSMSTRVTHKDAHDLIMEFIRSRPPLVPVSNRKLPPPKPKEPTMFDRLLESIRGQHSLKPTPTKLSPSHARLGRVREDCVNSGPLSAPSSPSRSLSPHIQLSSYKNHNNNNNNHHNSRSSEDITRPSQYQEQLIMRRGSDCIDSKMFRKDSKSIYPKKKIEANLNIKVLLSLDDDDDDIIHVNYS
ncbi:protein spire homolog 2-like [Brevipalpus obovatus]|uniref:protein spire homolog 2-like n=1 Tax=Brevipalpus obovatus TaxID=246614 RepID=UPI003D9DC7DF